MILFHAKDRQDWRNWLTINQACDDEIWLVYYKKHTGKQTLSHKESVEEAICFGWIDGMVKRLDAERYTHRFTKRRKKSKWSPTNVKMAIRLIKEGLMTKQGLAFFNQRIEIDKTLIEDPLTKELIIPTEILDALKSNEMAWYHFRNLAPGYQKQFIGWIVRAKQEATKKRRLNKCINLLLSNKKLGMK